MKQQILLLFILALLPLSLACEIIDMKLEQPKVVSVTPADHEQNVAPDASIIVTFSKQMDTVKTNNEFSLSNSRGTIEGYYSWSDNGKQLTFRPKSQLEDSDIYKINITTGAEDTDGNDLKNEYNSTFYINNDIFSPTIVSHTLGYMAGYDNSGTIGVTPDSSITITFSEEIDLNTLYDGLSISPATTGSYIWNDGITITFDPLYDLSYGTKYTVSLSDSIKDINGNPLSKDYTFEFTVGDDFVRPTITVNQPAIAPANWIDIETVNTAINNGVDKLSPVVLSFSEEIKVSELSNAVSLSPAADYYITTQTIPNSGSPYTEAQLNFNKPLQSDQLYTLTIGTSLTDLQNNSFEHEYIYQFRTNHPNSLALNVDTIDSGTSGVWQIGTPTQLTYTGSASFEDIIIAFSQDIKKETLDLSVVKDAGMGSSSIVIYDLQWITDSQLSFDISGLDASTIYIITVSGGENGIKDIYDNYMEESFTHVISFGAL